MPNRREFLVTAAGATAAGVSAFVSAPALSREQPNPAENATAITQVYGDGMRLMGVSVEYRRPVNAVQIRASDYRVEGRTVNNVYVSRTPAGTPYRSGRYVVIELDPYDAGAQPPPPAHARLPGQVASGEHVGKACVAQQCLHGGFLVVAVFQQQPAVGVQVGGGAADDDAQVIQSVGAGRQGLRRLEAQVALLQVVVVGRDVGGVGNNQVEASGAGQRLPPAACVPVDAAGSQGLCILLSDDQRLGGALDGMHLGVRSLQRQGDGDDAATGAQFQQGQRRVCRAGRVF